MSIFSKHTDRYIICFYPYLFPVSPWFISENSMKMIGWIKWNVIPPELPLIVSAVVWLALTSDQKRQPDNTDNIKQQQIDKRVHGYFALIAITRQTMKIEKMDYIFKNRKSCTYSVMSLINILTYVGHTMLKPSQYVVTRTCARIENLILMR